MGRAVGSWPLRVLLLPPQPGRAARSSWAVGARAEVLEVDTYGGQNGSMLTGVDVASGQPALAHLVGPLCVMDRVAYGRFEHAVARHRPDMPIQRRQ